MIIESGVIIFFGMLLLGIKLPRQTSLKLLGHPLALDLGISVLAYVLHGLIHIIQFQILVHHQSLDPCCRVLCD